VKLDIHEIEREGQLYENGAGNNIVGYSKLNIFVRSW